MFFLKKRFAMRCCPLLLSSLLLILVVPVHAFTVSSESQNTSISSPTHLIELAGYTQVGLVADSTPVNVIVAVPLNNIGVLQSMVKQISTPGSETFHHFLTMDQVKQLFLPTDQFKSTLSSLQESGFKVEFTALDSMIVASGTRGSGERCPWIERVGLLKRFQQLLLRLRFANPAGCTSVRFKRHQPDL